MSFYKNQFKGVEGTLATLKAEAVDRVDKKGVLNNSLEEWRFTSGKFFSSNDYKIAAQNNEPGNQLLDKKIKESLLLVLNLGQLDKSNLDETGLPEGLTISSFSDAVKNDPSLIERFQSRPNLPGQEGLKDLNLSFMPNGVHISVKKNTVIDYPIHILHENSTKEKSVSIHPFIYIELDANSQLSIVEEFSSIKSNKKWINSEVNISLGENSNLTHIVLNNECENTIQSSRLTVTADNHASYHGHNFNLGGQLLRQDSYIGLRGVGSNSVYNTLSLLDDTRHIGSYTWQSHEAPETTSHQTAKMILRDSATGVFNGRVIVKPEAQKTDAHQTNRNLLLSSSALVHSNPQLEIDADDVKCSHGSTTGELDDDALFYLQSRGINIQDAKALLIEGFAKELIDAVEIESVRTMIYTYLDGWLASGGKQNV